MTLNNKIWRTNQCVYIQRRIWYYNFETGQIKTFRVFLYRAGCASSTYLVLKSHFHFRFHMKSGCFPVFSGHGFIELARGRLGKAEGF
jgi:hypothetical protein